jgi:hypothetical protein
VVSVRKTDFGLSVLRAQTSHSLLPQDADLRGLTGFDF